MTTAIKTTAIHPAHQDISALETCIRGLDQSTSPRMLMANLEFLLDRYLWHPTKDLAEHLRPQVEEKQK